jgi:hypothetical protein
MYGAEPPGRSPKSQVNCGTQVPADWPNCSISNPGTVTKSRAGHEAGQYGLSHIVTVKSIESPTTITTGDAGEIVAADPILGTFGGGAFRGGVAAAATTANPHAAVATTQAANVVTRTAMRTR